MRSLYNDVPLTIWEIPRDTRAVTRPDYEDYTNNLINPLSTHIISVLKSHRELWFPERPNPNVDSHLQIRADNIEVTL